MDESSRRVSRRRRTTNHPGLSHSQSQNDDASQPTGMTPSSSVNTGSSTNSTTSSSSSSKKVNSSHPSGSNDGRPRVSARSSHRTSRRQATNPNNNSGSNSTGTRNVSKGNKNSTSASGMRKPLGPRDIAALGGWLKVLVADQILPTGNSILWMEYKDQAFHYDLDEQGRIWYNNKFYTSPSAVSILCKRTINPSRRADDGWTSIRLKATGETLKDLRQKWKETHGVPGQFKILKMESRPANRLKPGDAAEKRRRRLQREAERRNQSSSSKKKRNNAAIDTTRRRSPSSSPNFTAPHHTLLRRCLIYQDEWYENLKVLASYNNILTEAKSGLHTLREMHKFANVSDTLRRSLLQQSDRMWSNEYDQFMNVLETSPLSTVWMKRSHTTNNLVKSEEVQSEEMKSNVSVKRTGLRGNNAFDNTNWYTLWSLGSPHDNEIKNTVTTSGENKELEKFEKYSKTIFSQLFDDNLYKSLLRDHQRTETTNSPATPSDEKDNTQDSLVHTATSSNDSENELSKKKRRLYFLDHDKILDFSNRDYYGPGGLLLSRISSFTSGKFVSFHSCFGPPSSSTVGIDGVGKNNSMMKGMNKELGIVLSNDKNTYSPLSNGGGVSKGGSGLVGGSLVPGSVTHQGGGGVRSSGGHGNVNMMLKSTKTPGSTKLIVDHVQMKRTSGRERHSTRHAKLSSALQMGKLDPLHQIKCETYSETPYTFFVPNEKENQYINSLNLKLKDERGEKHEFKQGASSLKEPSSSTLVRTVTPPPTTSLSSNLPNSNVTLPNTNVTLPLAQQKTPPAPQSTTMTTTKSVGLQPFKVKLTPEVTFICDLHAHMSQNEIIGLLGGTWNPVTNEMIIKAAFPCRALDNLYGNQDTQGTNRLVNVEMDPSSEITVREIINAQGLKCVGWYHSHPTFCPDPSVRDVQNQTSYQHLFAKDVPGFVGLIVSPFDDNIVTNFQTIKEKEARDREMFFGVCSGKTPKKNEKKKTQPALMSTTTATDADQKEGQTTEEDSLKVTKISLESNNKLSDAELMSRSVIRCFHVRERNTDSTSALGMPFEILPIQMQYKEYGREQPWGHVIKSLEKEAIENQQRYAMAKVKKQQAAKDARAAKRKEREKKKKEEQQRIDNQNNQKNPNDLSKNQNDPKKDEKMDKKQIKTENGELSKSVNTQVKPPSTSRSLSDESKNNNGISTAVNNEMNTSTIGTLSSNTASEGKEEKVTHQKLSSQNKLDNLNQTNTDNKVPSPPTSLEASSLEASSSSSQSASQSASQSDSLTSLEKRKRRNSFLRLKNFRPPKDSDSEDSSDDMMDEDNNNNRDSDSKKVNRTEERKDMVLEGSDGVRSGGEVKEESVTSSSTGAISSDEKIVKEDTVLLSNIQVSSEKEQTMMDIEKECISEDVQTQQVESQ
eukprot:g3523.t1